MPRRIWERIHLGLCINPLVSLHMKTECYCPDAPEPDFDCALLKLRDQNQKDLSNHVSLFENHAVNGKPIVKVVRVVQSPDKF